MNLREIAAWILFFCLGLPAAIPARAATKEDQEQTAATEATGKDQPDGFELKGLPEWLKLSVELRGRAESGNAFDAPSDSLYLNRFRINTVLQPAPWVRLFIQGQDARAFGASGSDEEELQNTLDLHQAYAEFGFTGQGWRLRVGRQEIAIGDERLVGADTYWDVFGQSFDAVRAGVSVAGFRIDTFTGFRVQPSLRRLDPFDTSSRISGVTVDFKTRGGGLVQPYFLWKRGGDTLDLQGDPGHRDVLTPGARAQGALRYNLDYNIEMALQRGHVVADRISAWAGHWEMGWKPLGDEFGLRLGLEYNFASGDKDPADGRHNTFDDLYPAGFNKYGMEDPIAWRNIRYPAVGLELPVSRHWTVYGGYRYFQLATVQDGLYPGGDEYVERNPAATSTSVGSQVLVAAAYVRPRRWRLSGGYGYLFPGPYLRPSGYLAPLKTAYLQYSVLF